MRYLFTLVTAIFSLFTSIQISAQTNDSSYIVHEWGTFTTLQGSTGKLLSGLYLEEEHLPNFVYSHTGFSPEGGTQKGIYRPCGNVTVKMETPVIYFYSDKSLDVEVKVGFPRGSISQWYPQRSSGEEMKPELSIDFANAFNGWINWKAKVLAPGDNSVFSAPKQFETPTWTAPRATDANLVKAENGEVEKYLFYRGVGNFSMPVKAEFNANGELIITNTGSEKIPYFFVYEKKEDGAVKVWWTGAIAANENQKLISSAETLSASAFNSKLSEFEDALVAAGLYKKEAASMLATWKQSYFGTPGLRAFWIVPRTYTDNILPLNITPTPKQTERVLVGRSEVLSPEFEKELYVDFQNGNENKWRNDRYFLAYKERVEQMQKEPTTSLKNEQQEVSEQLYVYPNPAQSSCTVALQTAKPENIKLSVTNILGQNVIVLPTEKSTGNFQRQIQLNRLSKGIYLIKAETSQRQYIQRIIIE